jgi:hypothetical protein
MRRGDRIRIFKTGLARDARSEKPYTVYRNTAGCVIEMFDRRYEGVARVELEVKDYTGQELLVPYELLELAPGYATPSRA